MSEEKQEVAIFEGFGKPAHSLKKAVEANAVVAKELKELVVVDNPKLEYNGKRYITFGEWQTLGNAYDVSIETNILKDMSHKAEKKWMAEGRAIHTPTGKQVGYAQSICSNKEKGKGWQSDNQLASMAQTRAGSKALRNALGWVVELAGLPTTPLEEMMDPNDYENKQNKSDMEMAREAEKANKKVEEELKKDGNVEDAEFKVHDKKGQNTKKGTETKGKETGKKTEGKVSNGTNTKKTATAKKGVKSGVTEKVTDNKNAEKLKKEREKRGITKEDVKKELDEKHEKPYDTQEQQATFKKPDLTKMDGQELVAHIRNGIHTAGEVATEQAIKRTLTKLFKNKKINMEQRRESLDYLKKNS